MYQIRPQPPFNIRYAIGNKWQEWKVIWNDNRANLHFNEGKDRSESPLQAVSHPSREIPSP